MTTEVIEAMVLEPQLPDRDGLTRYSTTQGASLTIDAQTSEFAFSWTDREPFAAERAALAFIAGFDEHIAPMEAVEHRMSQELRNHMHLMREALAVAWRILLPPARTVH